MSLLSTRGLTAHYGDFQALFGVDIALNQGETIAIIGAKERLEIAVMCGQPAGAEQAHTSIPR